jgi:hypothetical protein
MSFAFTMTTICSFVQEEEESRMGRRVIRQHQFELRLNIFNFVENLGIREREVCWNYNAHFYKAKMLHEQTE